MPISSADHWNRTVSNRSGRRIMAGAGRSRVNLRSSVGSCPSPSAATWVCGGRCSTPSGAGTDLSDGRRRRRILLRMNIRVPIRLGTRGDGRHRYRTGMRESWNQVVEYGREGAGRQNNTVPRADSGGDVDPCRGRTRAVAGVAVGVVAAPSRRMGLDHRQSRRRAVGSVKYRVVYP